MSEIHLKRAPNGNGVIFSSEADRLAWGKLPLDKEMAITVRYPRNPQFHRWTRALISVLTDNWPGEYRPTEAEVVRWLKIYTGLFEMVTDLETGAKLPQVRSTSFDSMSQDEYFDWWTGLALPTCAAKLGINTEELVNELGIARAELTRGKREKVTTEHTAGRPTTARKVYRLQTRTIPTRADGGEGQG